MMTAQLASTSASTSSTKRTALLGHLLSGILSLVFLTSAVAKTRSFHELESTLAASRLVPVLLVSQAVTLLLVTEFLLALLLLLPTTRRSALPLFYRSRQRIRCVLNMALDAGHTCPLSLFRQTLPTHSNTIHSDQSGAFIGVGTEHCFVSSFRSESASCLRMGNVRLLRQPAGRRK